MCRVADLRKIYANFFLEKTINYFYGLQILEKYISNCSQIVVKFQKQSQMFANRGRDGVAPVQSPRMVALAPVRAGGRSSSRYHGAADSRCRARGGGRPVLGEGGGNVAGKADARGCQRCRQATEERRCSVRAPEDYARKEIPVHRAAQGAPRVRSNQLTDE
jgi:hypothetical protein